MPNTRRKPRKGLSSPWFVPRKAFYELQELVAGTFPMRNSRIQSFHAIFNERARKSCDIWAGAAVLSSAIQKVGDLWTSVAMNRLKSKLNAKIQGHVDVLEVFGQVDVNTWTVRRQMTVKILVSSLPSSSALLTYSTRFQNASSHA